MLLFGCFSPFCHILLFSPVYSILLKHYFTRLYAKIEQLKKKRKHILEWTYIYNRFTDPHRGSKNFGRVIDLVPTLPGPGPINNSRVLSDWNPSQTG